MISLRESLQKIGEPKPGKELPAFPSGFHSAPQSLRAALHAMQPPLIEAWRFGTENYFENLEWTEECQGLTSDGTHWFVVTNNNEHRAIWKFKLNFEFVVAELFLQADHIGAPDCHVGKIFVPVESSPASVWVLDTALKTVDIFPLHGESAATPPPQGSSMPWCAVNPWNGLLYSSIFGGDDPKSSDFGYVTRVHAYDTDNFLHRGDLVLQGEAIHNVQGGCFSRNGHLYLTSHSTQEVRAYSALNGAFLGSCKISYAKGGLEREEMEGMAILHWFDAGGASTHVHVMILDNDLTNRDDVLLKHLIVPDPSVL
jgi:hypothetical protein